MVIPDIVLPIQSPRGSRISPPSTPYVDLSSAQGSSPRLQPDLSEEGVDTNSWGVPAALENLLSWRNQGEVQRSVRSQKNSQSDVASSIFFSVIQDNLSDHRSDLLSAISCVNQNRTGVLCDMLIERPDLVRVCDAKGNYLIHYAVSRGHLQMIDLLVSRGADINQRNVQGYTPLHLAITHSQTAALLHLISLGSNVELADEKGVQPIHLACELNDAESLKLQAGADIYRADAVGYYGVHVAVLTGSTECLQRLFTHETTNAPTYSEVNFSDQHLIYLTDSEGETPLHSAVNCGNLEMIDFCLRMGASVEATQNEDFNAVHFACRRGDISVLNRLLEWQPDQSGKLLCSVCKQGCTPLHLAAKFNHAEMTAALIEHLSPMELRDWSGCTPLLLAIKNCATAAALTLIQLGADLHALDESSRNILHLAIISGALRDEKLWEHITKHGLFHLLVEEKDEFGCTALHYATKDCALNLTLELVDLGANCTAQNNERETPLHLAAHKGCLKTCESLLRTAHGLWAMNTPDDRGRLPLHIAALNGHARIVSLLIAKGSSFRRSGRGAVVDVYQLIWVEYVNYGSSSSSSGEDNNNILNSTEMTALHYAAKKDHSAVLEYFLQKGAKIEPDFNGIYFVTMALRKRNLKAAQAIAVSGRWDEIFDILSHTDQCPFEGFIREVPGLCSVYGSADKLSLHSACGVIVGVIAGIYLLKEVLFVFKEDFFSKSAAVQTALKDCFAPYRLIHHLKTNDTFMQPISSTLQAFQNPQLTLLNVLSMSLGDFNFIDTIINPLTDDYQITLHFPEVTLVMFIAFLLCSPMILTNLLVGLAVGDIDAVRKEATVRLIAQIVNWYNSIERAVPRRLYAHLVMNTWKSNSNFKNGARAYDTSDAGYSSVQQSAKFKEVTGTYALEERIQIQFNEMKEMIKALGDKKQKDGRPFTR
ncbi:hypothetical protein SprV_0401606400 [Sparganum proliferum]